MAQARRRVIGAPGSPSFSVTFMEPSVDVYETEDEVVIVLEMAGLSDQEIELEVEGSICTLRGERKPARRRPETRLSADGNMSRPLPT